MARFTLERGRWYGWSMYPGYVGPYFSPIRVERLTPLGTGRSLMELEFFNAGYASGVKLFSLRLQVLHRASDHLMAALLYDDKPPERTAVISELTWDWLKSCVPHHPYDPGFATAEQAVAAYYASRLQS